MQEIPIAPQTSGILGLSRLPLGRSPVTTIAFRSLASAIPRDQPRSGWKGRVVLEAIGPDEHEALNNLNCYCFLFGTKSAR
jgi:hypothetical protein